ncbi:hypothetical protein LINGRAHAP2_LOCUS2311, partial [Linum grandiflorum]
MQRHLHALQITEEEQFDLPVEPIPTTDYTVCVVGLLITTRPYNFLTMKYKMVIVWDGYEGPRCTKFKDSFLCMCVKLDTTKPLKRAKKIGHPEKPSFMCQFKYEKLLIICFICGCMDHIDRLCIILFQNSDVEPKCLWMTPL